MMQIASNDMIGRIRCCDGGSSGKGIAVGLGRQAFSRTAGETRGTGEGVEGGGGVEGAEADICRGLMRSRAVKRGLKTGRERPSEACCRVVVRTWNGSRLREKDW